jgi:hypothetical protein
MSEEVYPNAALGWRSWNFSADGKLSSVAYPDWAWQPGPNRAACAKREKHQAPAQNCSCGLYAYHHWSKRGAEPSFDPNCIWGAVAARGLIQSHYLGFRAEEMAILGFWVPPQCLDRELELVRQVSNLYNVDHLPFLTEADREDLLYLLSPYHAPSFTSFAALEKHALCFAEPLSKELRPKNPYDEKWKCSRRRIKDSAKRYGKDRLIGYLRQAASDLETETLSAMQYNRWCKTKWPEPDSERPSSIVISEWAGSWEKACQLAGIRGATSGKHISAETALRALKRYGSEVKPPWTIESYGSWRKLHHNLPPSAIMILGCFGSWKKALQAAEL